MENKKMVIIGVCAFIVGVCSALLFVSNKNLEAKRGSYSPNTEYAMMERGTMYSAMNDMMADLQGKTGLEFDEEFLEEMIIHHEGAVTMAEAALLHAEHEELKQMARDIISAQTKEINQMKVWQREWVK